MTTQRVLVTGANKGIGRAIVERLIAEHPDVHVYLGSRDASRGEATRAEILAEHAGAEARLEVLPIDVADDASVNAAAERVETLYGLVNNAGIGRHGNALARVLEVNARGPRRVCEAFASKLVDGGRVVIVTSASGPMFVNRCSAEMQRVFTDPAIEWSALDALMQEAVGIADAAAFEAKGLADGDAYGLSKACANAVMHIVARERPSLSVNACTPGFIATDMTAPYAEASGQSPEEMGMKTPHEGARTPLHLLFGELGGNAWYYGSDAERSPLDRYRAPGDPPFSG